MRTRVRAQRALAQSTRIIAMVSQADSLRAMLPKGAATRTPLGNEPSLLLEMKVRKHYSFNRTFLWSNMAVDLAKLFLETRAKP